MVQGDKVILLKGYGYRDAEKQLPVTPNTLFAIGSITKSFTVSTLGMETGAMRNQIANHHLLRQNRVVHFKRRQVLADRFVPIHFAFVHLHADSVAL